MICLLLSMPPDASHALTCSFVCPRPLEDAEQALALGLGDERVRDLRLGLGVDLRDAALQQRGGVVVLGFFASLSLRGI